MKTTTVASSPMSAGRPKIEFHTALEWLIRHKKVLLFSGLGVLLVAVLSLFVWHTQRPVTPRLASSNLQAVAVNEPLRVSLDQSVNSNFSARISPKTEGDWQVQTNVFGAHEIVFIPGKEGLKTNTKYEISINDMKRVTGQAVAPIEIAFKTEAAPKITNVTPADKADTFAADGVFSVELASANRGMRELSLVTEPAIKLKKLSTKNDKIFQWQPESPLEQGKAYTLQLFDARSSDAAKPLQTIQFTTAPEPAIAKMNNEQFLYPEGFISVQFSEPMQQSAAGIKCECEGAGKWASPTEYQFTPAKIEVNKTYRYVVPKGLRSDRNGFRAADAVYEIRTPGNVQASVAGLGSSAKLNAAVTVSFDQAVNQKSAESKFAISPQIGGTFKWLNASTMQFVPAAEYAAQTGYTVTINSGVEPVRFGLASNAAFMGKFTTEARTVKLAVPVYQQQYPSSCEAASLRMALAYRGINDGDASIVQKMGYNPRPGDAGANTWDDPDEMYVGDITKRQAKFQAYGAHAAPIAKAARAYGRSAEAHYNITPSFIAGQIHAGNPVIIIGTVSVMSPIPTTWNGPNGLVYGWMGEHARVVIGVVGAPENPVGFWVNDPYRGTQEYWTTARLAADIATIPQVPAQGTVIY